MMQYTYLPRASPDFAVAPLPSCGSGRGALFEARDGAGFADFFAAPPPLFFEPAAVFFNSGIRYLFPFAMFALPLSSIRLISATSWSGRHGLARNESQPASRAPFEWPASA